MGSRDDVARRVADIEHSCAGANGTTRCHPRAVVGSEPPGLPIHVRVGDTIAFVAPAYSVPVYHEDGSVYDPLPPEVSDPALLRAAVYADTCEVHTTCAAWIASAAGTTTVAESGPSGLVCDLVPVSTELSCAGVAAAWWSQDIVIDAS